MPEFLQRILFDFLLVFATLLALKYFPRPLRKLKLTLWRCARRKRLSLVVAGAVPVLLHLAFYQRPEPAVHDEFAYLLQADTFAHGRWANPPRPLWQHFEQFHVLSQPVFASKYPPLPAALLAAGQLFGDPYYGLLLTTALAFCAVLWMLYGWLPPGYALLGWLIALAKLGPSCYWMNSYWGGLAPALGGFLIIGAWPRLRRKRSLSSSILLGVGIVVVLASRPYEGLLISALACGSLLWFNRGSWVWLRGASVVAVLGLSILAYYNFKVVGNPWRLPYQEYNAQYAAVGNFVFSHPVAHPPVYRHPAFRAIFYDRFVKEYQTYDAWKAQGTRLSLLWGLFCDGWPLGLPFLAVPFAWPNRRFRWVIAMLILFIAGLSLVIGFLPHYAAPGAGLFILALVAGLHRLRLWNPQGRPTGSLLARIAVVATLAFFVRDVIQKPHGSRSGDDSFKQLRRDMIQQLNAQPGKHLVIVQYSALHNADMEFVVNGADADTARILWARSMNPAADQELLSYFHDRHAWLLEGDSDAPRLQPIAPGLSARR